MEIQNIKDNVAYLILIGTFGTLFLAVSVVMFYLRYQRKFLQQNAELKQREIAHQQTVLHAILQSQEDERLRISKDLHDHIGSSLSRLRFIMAGIQRCSGEQECIDTAVEECKAGIDNLIEDIRDISHTLSPAGLNLWGLHTTLEAYCDKMARASGIAIEVKGNAGPAMRKIPFDNALSLYRIIQELVSNTIKHAAANRIQITTCEDENRIIINYTDDGIGTDADVFNRDNAGIGMFNIKNRLDVIGASYEVNTGIDKGFAFTIQLPQH